MRAPLYPAGSPASRTRAERFDAVVLEALEPIEDRWGAELDDLDVAVDDVPDVGDTTPDDDGVVGDGDIPLARLVPAGVDRRGAPTRARIVLYRRPLEARALDAGVEVLHAPREWPEYHPGYYGVFLRDPDGHNVEAVHHGS